MLHFVSRAFLLLGALALAPLSSLHAELGLARGNFGVWDREGLHAVTDYPYARGQSLDMSWGQVNPARNTFDWSEINQNLQSAEIQNQAFTCKVSPIDQSAPTKSMPGWMFSAGVPSFSESGTTSTGTPAAAYVYGYYLDPEFKIYFEEMVKSLASYLRTSTSITASQRARIAFVRVDTGATGDEEPYENAPLVPALYQIGADAWQAHRRWVFEVYRQAFQEGPGPIIPLLFVTVEPPDQQTQWDWILANVKGGFGIKHGGQLRGYHLTESESNVAVFKPLAVDSDFKFFSRNEMDQTWQYPYFSLNRPMSMYWAALEQLNVGMSVWDWSGSCMENASAQGFAFTAEFFNKWAAELEPATAGGAFCFFHDGLDSADTSRFPETDTYGGSANKGNTNRYVKICEQYASQGAAMDHVEAATWGQVAQRNPPDQPPGGQLGFNDAGWQIHPGNYDRFITQLLPNTTSKGLWRVRGPLTATSDPYDRFARRSDHAAGNDTMYFDINDNLLPSLGQRVRLSVTYLDRGTGQFSLNYDAASSTQKTAFTVTKMNTDTWKTQSIEVTDWRFGNRGTNGSDLQLVNLMTDAANPDTIFHGIEVIKQADVNVGIIGQGTVTGRNNAAAFTTIPPSVMEGQRLELQATPGPGWVFTGWSGALSGTNPNPFLFPTKDTRLTATFSPTSVSSSVDSFDSVTWSGGTGWSGDWTASSTVKPGATVELYGGSPIPQITRTLAPPLTSATLSFDWDLDRTTGPGLVEVFDGTWHTVWTQIDKGTDSGSTVDLVTTTLSLSSFGAISQIRFTLNSIVSGDRLWIDNVTITGVPSVAAYNTPQFRSDPLSKTSATSGTAYTGQTLAGDATDPNSQPLTFTKLSKISGGTDWLTVSSSGVLSGTPTSADAGLNRWAAQVSSAGGSDTVTLLIDVSAPGLNPPTALTYSFPSAYTKGTAIANLLPTSSGGIVMRYVASPDLPKGLYLNSTTGSISGTPIEVAATATYAITATNADGSTTTSYAITVNDIAPSALTYSSNPAAYTSGVAIPSNTPTNSGGGVMLYAVSPALPAGLTLNTSTGVISGTPLATSPTTPYTVTATNSGGSTTAQVSITVTGFAPTSLSYSSNPAIYTKGTAITQNVPASSGGAVASYSVTPALPAGLTLDPTTGFIIGTPTTVTPSASYTITAANTNGSTTASVSITVNDIPPTSLGYSNNPAVFTVGTALVSGTKNLPTSSGGVVVSYSITPALPAGLALNSQGETRGTPTVASPTTVYTVMAVNSGGSTTASLTITVNSATASSAPANLTYSTNPATYTKGTAITNNSPSSTGGAVLSYSVTPALPAGLALNTSSGIISGTPTTVTSAANYIVTATNSSGFTTASVNITVNDIAPSALSYSNNPAIYTKGLAITANIPTSSGGAVTSYVVSPALPAGLTLNPTTGVISGTPTVATPTASYTVTATNSGGSTNATLSITVNDSVTYSNTSAITITDKVAATPYPSLIIVPATTGTVTKVTVSLVGFNHSYPGDVDILLVGPSGQKLLLMSDAGGATDVVNANIVFTDTASASLPNSLISSGTYKPTNYDTNSDTFPSPAPASPYVATLSTFNSINPTGTWSLYVRDDSQQDPGSINGGWSLSFEITPPPTVIPSSLAYSSSPATYSKGTAVAANTPTSSGGAVTSYVVSPALPAGLTLNPTTGVISGTPTALTAASNYTVTATNTGGSTTASVSITVNDIAPSALAYLINPAIYIQGSAITANNPTSSGGVVLSYAILPALPAGLTLNPLTGVISGTPSEVSPAASYSVTATNTGGFTSALVSITVVSPYTAWATPYNLVQDLNGDDDGDGNSNYFEFIAGLVPTNAGSVFKISVSSVPGQPSHRAIVISPIIIGRTYTVKSSESLSPPLWISLNNPQVSDAGNLRTVIDTAATEAKKFYMIEISTP